MICHLSQVCQAMLGTKLIFSPATPQYGDAAAAEGLSWAGDAVAAPVRGGLGSSRLADAEAKAQWAWRLKRTPGTVAPDPCKPLNTRRLGASILEGVARGMTPPVARTLAERGLVGPLLQVGPHDHVHHRGSTMWLWQLHLSYLCRWSYFTA